MLKNTLILGLFELLFIMEEKMIWIIAAIGFIATLVALITTVIYVVLKRKNDYIYMSRKILYAFKPNDDMPDISEMICFHKKNQNLNKYIEPLSDVYPRDFLALVA